MMVWIIAYAYKRTSVREGQYHHCFPDIQSSPSRTFLQNNIWIKKISSSLKMFHFPSQILRFCMSSTLVLDTIAVIEGGSRKLIDEDTSNLRGSVFGVFRKAKLPKYNSTMD